MGLIIVLLIAGTLVLGLVFPAFGCALLHPFSTTGYGVVDILKYIRYKKWNDAEKTVGEIACFQGLFGHGKTLSEVHYVTRLYNQYNGKMVFKDGSWKRQNVMILSNIELTKTPYRHFVNFQQLVDICDGIKDFDEENNSYTICYVIIDEMQNVCNSRNFKSNFSSASDVLRVLTQIRKYRCSIWYTSTRFNQTDAFIRQDTMYVYNVAKYWRFQRVDKFDAWDLECSNNVQLCKPLSRSCWFIRNKDYAAYDTHALATQISQDVKSGSMIPEDQRCVNFSQTDVDGITHKSKSLKRSLKKGRK